MDEEVQAAKGSHKSSKVINIILLAWLASFDRGKMLWRERATKWMRWTSQFPKMKGLVAVMFLRWTLINNRFFVYYFLFTWIEIPLIIVCHLLQFKKHVAQILRGLVKENHSLKESLDSALHASFGEYIHAGFDNMSLFWSRFHTYFSTMQMAKAPMKWQHLTISSTS